MVGSHCAIGTPRVPGSVRNAVCSRWWWALTSPGVTTQPVASSTSRGPGTDPRTAIRPSSPQWTSTPANSSPEPVHTARAPATVSTPTTLTALCSVQVTAGTPPSRSRNDRHLASRRVTARLLTDLSAPAISAALGPDSVIVLPTGALEQHGPHLPVATDLITAQGLAEQVVEQFGDELDLWLLPPLAYTKSNEHAWSAGTFWLSAATLTAVLADIGRCVAMTPARRLAFLNGHGGNSALLQVAARDIRLETGLRTFTLHPAAPADQGGASPADELGMGVHAGLEETSLMLHLRPELVDMSLADRWVPEHLDAYRHVRFGGSVSFGWSSDDFGPAGVIGDATQATAELGGSGAKGWAPTPGGGWAGGAASAPPP